MSSDLYTSWKIPTGLTVSRYGELTYTPEISAIFNHEFAKWPLDEFRCGPFLRFNHSLGFDRINWHENYRKGLSVYINNSYTYDFYRLKTNTEPLSVSFSAKGTGYFIISKFFGISSHLQYRHWFYHDPEYNEQASNVLRGIYDTAIAADYMLSLNTDFPIRVLIFAPSEWFNNRKLHFFDFELQISPVIDMALYHDPGSIAYSRAVTSFSLKNMAVTGGLEFIVFPAFMRRLYLRVCLAYNLKEMFTVKPFGLPGGENREISLSMGHFY
jgi:hypothetical protein